MKSVKKAVELQRAADRNEMKGFSTGLKEVWGPKKKGPVYLKSTVEMEGDLLRQQESCGKIE